VTFRHNPPMPSPFPSRATKRKERDDRARVPGPVSMITPGNTWALFNSCPAPSLLELQRERRETTELGYPGRCRRQPPETHGPCSGPHVAKSLVYGSGPGSSWGDRASSSPRFNTYSRGCTHLVAARPAPSFFYRSAL
jgi:hypothetical protein